MATELGSSISETMENCMRILPVCLRLISHVNSIKQKYEDRTRESNESSYSSVQGRRKERCCPSLAFPSLPTLRATWQQLGLRRTVLDCMIWFSELRGLTRLCGLHLGMFNTQPREALSEWLRIQAFSPGPALHPHFLH